MALVRVFLPDTEPELVTVVAMLVAREIPCFVHSAGFGSLYPGPQIDGYNRRTIMVPEENVAAALELIQDFQSQPSDEPEPQSKPPAGRFRSLIELLLFGWFVPGGRRPERRARNKA